ncbi:NTF2 domain-containing protein [Caenorhabditis elegans]|uniref:NTF2 domain-containing protein n=1 Tax=Caenorhabditis elegans TaxID=6239 RepID=O18697_CAEEL|nr:NTF2 domain-containing protein [Caenorhabditis elegans]CAB03285.1 NTF2 domain-containing protein [Caenorhabditis elegans]|eukprot:NP_493340.1 Uncharacterized protein CELE_T04D3.1 [Caenorhabditis elegans]
MSFIAYPCAVPTQRQVPMSPPTTPRILMKLCPIMEIPIIGGPRQNGTYNVFIFDLKIRKFIPHRCSSCAVKILEDHLSPMYASGSVIFMRNEVTQEVEQYVYSFETGGFQQVDYPELVYSAEKFTESSFIVMIENSDGKKVLIERGGNEAVRKLEYRLGKCVEMPKVEVQLLAAEEFDDADPWSDNDSLSSEHLDYNETLPAFKTTFCQDFQMYVLYIITSRGHYEKYIYNQSTSQFEILDCEKCPDTTREVDLLPKYAEFCEEIQAYVIHVFNSFTDRMEQYVFDSKIQGFVEVNQPELKYDSSKDQDPTSSIFFVLKGTTVIMRGAQGRLKKEVYCSIKKHFVEVPNSVIKSFDTQFMEKKQKMDKKKKAKKIKKSKKKASKESQELDVLVEKIRLCDDPFSDGPSCSTSPDIPEDAPDDGMSILKQKFVESLTTLYGGSLPPYVQKELEQI